MHTAHSANVWEAGVGRGPETTLLGPLWGQALGEVQEDTHRHLVGSAGSGGRSGARQGSVWQEEKSFGASLSCTLPTPPEVWAPHILSPRGHLPGASPSLRAFSAAEVQWGRWSQASEAYVLLLGRNPQAGSAPWHQVHRCRPRGAMQGAGWASWPGLQCQDPKLCCGPASHHSLCFDPALAVSRSRKRSREVAQRESSPPLGLPSPGSSRSH